MIGFIVFLSYIVTIFLVNKYLFLFIGLLINILVMCIAKINVRKVLNNFIGVIIFSMFIFFINLIVMDIKESLMLSTKLILICNITYIFSKILTPLKMIENLEKILYPVKAVGIESKNIGILICVGISFIPIFNEEMTQVLYSIKSKCVKIGVKNFYLVVSPMISSTLKKTNDVEMSLKAKGYQ